MTPQRLSVGIVGGGIAGLYCAWKLAKEGCDVMVFECLDHLGGRIETHHLAGFKAECGPMRFELAIQPKFATLARALDVEFKTFPETRGELAEFPRYTLQDDEKSKAQLRAENKDRTIEHSHLTSSLDLLKLGVYRILALNLQHRSQQERKRELPEIVNYRIFAPHGRKPAPPAAGELPKWERHTVKEAAFKLEIPENEVRVKVQRREIRSHKGPNGEHLVDLKIPRIAEYANGLNDSAFHAIRSTWRLGNDGSLLYKTGFWNALNYVLSPGAIAKIRDLGTFYHLMPENPSGSEWTIFWLRLFRSDAQLSTVDHEKGVRIVVDRLEEKLEEIGKPDVDLRKDATVTRVGPGEMLGHKVRLTVESAQLAEDDFDFDHVILALPQWPLQRLASSFPINIRKHIEGVIAFPLLKAFVVTENPWWDEHTPSQHGAHLVPTRELHYHWREGENNSDPLGMLMLYTDRPANGYWMPYVRKPHTQAQKEERGALRNELARHVLFALYRHNENTKKKRTASEIAKAQDISLPRGANETAQMEKAQKLAAERVKGAQPGIEEVARATLRSDKAIEIFEGSEGEPSDRARELVNMPAEEAIKDINETIRICAIRDWTQPPFGAGCHAWAPGVCVPEALRGLKAFSLQGPEGFPNLHVCGEAYSDYQGFIEGALKSADLVIETILP